MVESLILLQFKPFYIDIRVDHFALFNEQVPQKNQTQTDEKGIDVLLFH